MVWLVVLGVAALAVVLTQWAPALGFASVVLVVIFVIGGCVGLAVWVGGWEERRERASRDYEEQRDISGA
jgi:hypothetical protein